MWARRSGSFVVSVERGEMSLDVCKSWTELQSDSTHPNLCCRSGATRGVRSSRKAVYTIVPQSNSGLTKHSREVHEMNSCEDLAIQTTTSLLCSRSCGGNSQTASTSGHRGRQAGQGTWQPDYARRSTARNGEYGDEDQAERARVTTLERGQTLQYRPATPGRTSAHRDIDRSTGGFASRW